MATEKIPGGGDIRSLEAVSFCHYMDHFLQRLPLLEIQMADRSFHGFPRFGRHLFSRGTGSLLRSYRERRGVLQTMLVSTMKVPRLKMGDVRPKQSTVSLALGSQLMSA